jgi:hypothetical protein
MNIFNWSLSNLINNISGGGSNNNTNNSPIELVSPIFNSNPLGNYSNYGNFVGGPFPNLTYNPLEYITPLVDTGTSIINPISNTANNA